MSASLGLGTATFAPGYSLGGDILAPAAAAALVRLALHAGVRYIDTARAYGDAERVVSAFADEIAEFGVRVCTKISAADAKRQGAARAVKESLDRLKLSHVDTVLLHNVTAEALMDVALARELEQVVAQGLVARAGASTYGISDARRAIEQSWCRAIQIEHSILNPSVVASLKLGTERPEIVARSVLCKGLLSSRRDHADATVGVELAQTLDSLARLAAEWEWPLPEIAIRFALDTPGVDVVVIGVSNEAEFETALSAWRRSPLSHDAYGRLAAYDRSSLDASHPERWTAPRSREMQS